MTSSKSTKRALISSTLAILLCVAMLIGTTFAWFTDTASTGVNKITSGNLHVEIQDKEGTEIDTLKWVDKDGNDIANQDDILWEPGCTYLLTPFQIVNTGNLALKYKIVITGLDGDSLLLDVIKFTYKTASGEEFDMSAEGHLAANGGSTGMITVSAHMDEAAGNKYQDQELTNVRFTVYATQDTVESDSYDNQYDKDAAYAVYPDGVTTDTFPESVSYPTYNGKTETAEAVAAYVDSEGNAKYAADIANAIKDGATTIYLKKGADVKANIWGTNRTPDLTTDLTIYANGADFQYGNISLNMTAAGKAANLTLKVYDANNLYVWGGTPNDGVTQTVILENCHNEGSSAIDSNSRMFYITGTTGTVNVTLRNCSVAKAEAPVYMKNNGSVTLENCSFSECASAVKISHAATGTCDVTITNTTFDKCGCTTEMAPNGPAYLTDDSSSIKCKTKGTMTLTLDNVAITNVVGNNSIVVDGDTGYTGTTTVNATNVTVDGATWTK
jgi:predicted ribosomally synthesized peptide with SipW-like signal peptide